MCSSDLSPSGARARDAQVAEGREGALRNAGLQDVSPGLVRARVEDRSRAREPPLDAAGRLRPQDARADAVRGLPRCLEVEEVERRGDAHDQDMATSAMFWGGASYNNGILPYKRYILGEAYTREGLGASVENPVKPDPFMRPALTRSSSTSARRRSPRSSASRSRRTR